MVLVRVALPMREDKIGANSLSERFKPRFHCFSLLGEKTVTKR